MLIQLFSSAVWQEGGARQEARRSLNSQTSTDHDISRKAALGAFPFQNNNVNHQPKTNMNAILTFFTNGTGSCLHTELMDLHSIGRLQITRASTIEFNNATQHWEVKDRKGKVRFIARSSPRVQVLVTGIDFGLARIGGLAIA